MTAHISEIKRKLTSLLFHVILFLFIEKGYFNMKRKIVFTQKTPTIPLPKEKDYDKEAYQHFLCEGINGKGCGIEKQYISHYRRERTWKELCHSFWQHDGD